MKVYDCFTFFNEFELLELRLSLLNDVVDHFVLVEANKTHKNDIKDFNFDKNKEKFARYLDKIIHIKVDDMPNYSPDDEWRLENYQRNCIARGLGDIDSKDIVFISDLDEIPSPNLIRLLNDNKVQVNFKTGRKRKYDILQIIKYFPESLSEFHGMQLLNKTPLALEQNLFYYFVNCKSKVTWNGSVITKAKNLSSPQKLRDKRNKLPRIKNSGWHFSYLGGAEKIMLKLNSIVEGPDNAYSTGHINRCIVNGLDIYGRKGKEFEYEFIDIDKNLPAQVKFLTKKYPYLYFDTDANAD